MCPRCKKRYELEAGIGLRCISAGTSAPMRVETLDGAMLHECTDG